MTSLPDEARAAVLVEPGRVELRSFPVPDTGADDGLLAVEGSGVCGADWSAYEGKLKFLRNRSVVLGHEVVGTIARLGDKAAARWRVQVGDRVVVEEPIPCGTCRDCLAGSYHWCRFGPRFGATDVSITPALMGGYAEYMYLPPQSLVHKLSAEVPVEQATLFIPLSNGLHWVQEVGQARVGSTVLIQGPGQNGLAAVIAARESGAGQVIVTGTRADARRLEIAKALGADHTFSVDDDDVVSRVKDITAGEMADVVIHVAPSARALEQAVDVVARRGTIVCAGLAEERASFDLYRLMQKEVTLRAVAGRPNRAVASAVKLLEGGKYPFEIIGSHVFGLAETEAALRAVGRVDGNDTVLHASVLATTTPPSSP